VLLVERNAHVIASIRDSSSFAPTVYSGNCLVLVFEDEIPIRRREPSDKSAAPINDRKNRDSARKRLPSTLTDWAAHRE